jgi:hypothetical protein
MASGAVQLYWRYKHARRNNREPIGIYDPSAPPKKLRPTARGYSIAAALEKCRDLAHVHAARAGQEVCMRSKPSSNANSRRGESARPNGPSAR